MRSYYLGRSSNKGDHPSEMVEARSAAKGNAEQVCTPGRRAGPADLSEPPAVLLKQPDKHKPLECQLRVLLSSLPPEANSGQSGAQ